MSESRILVRLLRMYFPRNWEFGSALSKLRNFGGGGGFEHPQTPPLGTPLITTESWLGPEEMLERLVVGRFLASKVLYTYLKVLCVARREQGGNYSSTPAFS